MSILQMYLSIPITPESLSSAKTLSSGSISAQPFPLTTKLSNLSLTAPISIPFRTAPVCMGGGPRTYPGGVSKWQWKRMQANKAKQLLKARLARERQIYEMRKRAELKAAVSELERPWETVEKPPTLFSVGADEQLKVLADRFQKPGGLDLWSERDGPELFRPDCGLPSSRFFPKGVVHSVKPYGKLGTTSGESETLGPNEHSGSGLISGNVVDTGLQRNNGEYKNSRSNVSSLGKEGESGGYNGRFRKKGMGPKEHSGSGLISGNVADTGPQRKNREYKNSRSNLSSSGKEGESGGYNGKLRKKGNRKNYSSDSEKMNSGDAGYYDRINGTSRRRSGTNGQSLRSKNNHEMGKNVNSEVFDMNLQNDGTYGFELDKF